MRRDGTASAAEGRRERPPGGAMRAVIAGEGGGAGTPVVYLPGIDGTGELLLGTAERIERSYRLLRLRYEGCGPRGDVLYPGLAGSVAGLLEERQVPPAIVLAESFGGGVALQLALDHPERVAALALVNTFCWFPWRVRAALGDIFFPITPAFVLRFGRRHLPGPLFFRPRRDAQAEAAFSRVVPGFEDRGYRDRLCALRHLDLRQRLAEISQPVALFAATSDRIVPTLRTMKAIERGLPDATLELLENAGHLVLPLAEEPWVERLGELERRIAARAAPRPA